MTTKPIKLSRSEIRKIRAFLDPIHKFDIISQRASKSAIAQAQLRKNKKTLFINPSAWIKENDKNKNLSDYQKGVLLHEAAHSKMRHGENLCNLIKSKHANSPERTIIKAFKDAICQFEVEAQEWAMNYALDQNWQDIHYNLVLDSIFVCNPDYNRGTHYGDLIIFNYNLGELSKIYYAAGLRLIKIIRECKHKNFNKGVLKIIRTRKSIYSEME